MRVLVADDHPTFRAGIQAILATAADVELVGEACDGDEAVTLAASLRPDVILMDVAMPGRSGVEATRAILAAYPNIRILMLTMVGDDASVLAAMRAGARGYLLKDATRDDILQGIRTVATGAAVLAPAAATTLLGHLAQPTRSRPFPELTDREYQILDLIAAGRGNQDIARALFLGHNTVRNYVSSIFAKLQVSDRAQAIVRARRAGLG